MVILIGVTILATAHLCLCISVWYLHRMFRKQLECNRLVDHLFALCDKRLSRIEKEWNARVMQDLRNNGYDSDPDWEATNSASAYIPPNERKKWNALKMEEELN